MGITTDTTIDVQIGGITVDTIGLSDTLDNYSIEDIISSGYCSLNHGLWLCGYTYTYQDQKIMTSNIPVTLDSAGFPIECSAGDPQGYNYPDGKYCAIVWLYSTNATFDYAITDINCDNYRMVTEWNAPRYVYYPASPSTNGVLNTYRYGNWTDNEIPYGVWSTTNDNSFQHCYYWSDDLGTDKVEVQYIKPYLAFVNENDVPFLLSFDYGYSYACGMYGDTSAYAYNSANISFDRSENVAYTVAIDSLGNANLAPPNVDTMPFTMNSYGRYGQGWTADGKFAAQIVFGSSSIAGHSGYLSFETYFMLHSKDDIFRFIANTGLKFYTDKLYKPIISGGHVTGYTDDMDEESELDEWDGTTNHGASPYPPVPPTPEGDDIDVNSFGGGSKLGGVDNLWLLTAQQLSDLHTAMNNNNDPNFEPLNSIISVLGLAISPMYIFGDDISTVTNITIKKADGTSWSSGVNGHICSSQVSSFGLTGNIAIKRKYNNFLDYPPYASHEIFLPLCGWIPLPSCCVGRQLSVYYVPDIQTGGVRGLVLCDGCIVGEKYGILGGNIPFTSNGHGLMLGGIISGGVQTLADFATAMGGLATGNAITAVYGGSSFFSDGFNMTLAANQNRTSVIGQNQDRTGFSDGTYIRIKSVYQDVKIDPLFGHTIGYLCHESGLLSDFHGFTVCENPHIHISATSAEKEEIKRLLEEGVILPSASS